MTVEAAIVLPLFLMCMLTLLYVTEVMRQSGEKQQRLMNAAVLASTAAYSIEDRLNKNQVIDLFEIWKSDIPFAPKGVPDLKIIDRARVKAFTGYDNTRGGRGSAEDDEIVYITPFGEVYHTHRNCRHLKLNIMEISRSEISSKRNNGGGKYYPCEFCGSRGGNKTFITDDGDRWHTTKECPGLKRGIREVPLSEVEGMRKCADCGE
ncbi:MAG: pilus assembly protein [Lachnospiraceae bacterium]|nr:pilus assembly protein [Lachnospiraceae bacterium]